MKVRRTWFVACCTKLILISHGKGKKASTTRKNRIPSLIPPSIKATFLNLYIGNPNSWLPKKGLFQVSQQLLAVSPMASLDCNTIANDLGSQIGVPPRPRNIPLISSSLKNSRPGIFRPRQGPIASSDSGK